MWKGKRTALMPNCAAAVLILAALLTGPALGRPDSGTPLPSSWTMFRLNPQLNPVLGKHLPLQPAWVYKTGGGISSSPTLADGILLVSSNDHNLYAIDVLSGKLRWRFTARNMLMSAPLVKHGVVIVGDGGFEQIDWQPGHYMAIGAGTNSLWGLDESNGKVFWRTGLLGTGMPTGIIIGRRVLVHDGAGMLVNIDLLNGLLQWRRDLMSAAAMTAVNMLTPGVLVLSGNEPNTILAYSLKARRVLWRHEFTTLSGGPDDCPPAIDGGRIFCMYLKGTVPNKPLATGDRVQQYEYALSSSGKLLWTRHITDGVLPPRNSSAIPMAHAGTLYEGSAIAPIVTALDERTGKVRWRLHTAGPVKGGMVALDGVVYFGDLSGYLWAVDAASGRKLGRKKMPDGFNVGSPIIVGKSLIIGTKQGWVYAVPLSGILAAND